MEKQDKITLLSFYRAYCFEWLRESIFSAKNSKFNSYFKFILLKQYLLSVQYVFLCLKSVHFKIPGIELTVSLEMNVKTSIYLLNIETGKQNILCNL